jgi:ribonuclease HII
MLKSNFKNVIEIGLDESGYGSGIGRLYVAGVIFPIGYINDSIDDSKKLSEKKRNELVSQIQNDAIEYQISFIDEKEVDSLGVYQARFKAFHKCLDSFKSKFESIIVDGNRFLQYKDYKHETIVKGDTKYLSIAAASILAKTYRDNYVLDLFEKENRYAWDKNKGYLTKEHLNLIEQYGISKYHRKTFLKKYLESKNALF